MCNTTPCDVIDVTVEPDEFEVFEVAEISWVVFSLLKFDRRYETESFWGQKNTLAFMNTDTSISLSIDASIWTLMHESQPGSILGLHAKSPNEESPNTKSPLNCGPILA